MTRMIELTDLMKDNAQPVVVPVSAVARTLREWYGSATGQAEDEEKIDEFAEALAEQDDELARDLAAELAVGFDEMQTEPGY